MSGAPRVNAGVATHCRRGHRFTPENTYTYPDGSRNCRTCRRHRELLMQSETCELTCPDCGETRSVGVRPRKKKYPPEVCGRCAVARSNQSRGRTPKPPPLPVEVMVDADDWRLPEERLSPRETWLRMSVRERAEFRAALRWLPTPNEEVAA